MSLDLTKFAHLHTHSEYSFLDGMIRIKDLVKKTKEQGLEYTALTDHGGLFGAMEFQKACGKDIAPIIGFEAYIVSGSRFDKKQEPSENGVESKSRNHLILLAEDQIGWKNLMHLSSVGYTEGFYGRPRIDMEVLREHSKGIIATSACIAGMIPQAFLNKFRSDEDNFKEAERILDEYLSIFGENNFFLELQKHGIEDEEIAYKKVIELGKKKGVPFIVANDAHYLNAEDAEAHEVLLALQTQSKMTDAKRYKFSTEHFWLKDPAEMANLFPEIPEAFTNTYEIAKRCGGKIKIKNDPQMPSPGVEPIKFPEEKHKKLLEKINSWVEEDKKQEDESKQKAKYWGQKIAEDGSFTKEFDSGLEEAEYLTQLAFDGAERIYGERLKDEDFNKKVVDRLEYELDVIIKMGFQGYYLVVRDFLKRADELGIFRGVRGSAAGSLVGYCVEISNVCPLKYELFFERFLNPERISLPDVDCDLAEDRRQEVIDYCREKYGKENVCQIVNFGTMKSKMAIKDVARTLDIPLDISNKLTKLVGEGLVLADAAEDEKAKKDKKYQRIKKDKLSIKEALAASAELQKMLAENSQLENLFKFAVKFEGLTRQPGIHAAGVVLAPGDVRNWAPLAKQAGEKPVVSQFDMHFIEDSGMIKMDILGLRTLTLLKNAIDLIEINHKKKIDPWKDIPLDDEFVYKEIFHKANTVEIFQFESAGMRKYLKQLKAGDVEDLTTMTAMYRPGPMENIEALIDAKHGRTQIKYHHPKLEPILKVTYGFIVYQEQVMSIAREIGEFTMGQADELRKAMGKKLKDKMDAMHPRFIDGAKRQEIDEKTAEIIWADMEKFASYGFNKAHACVYAHISYQSAYLKAYYPVEYMAAVITSRMGDNERFVTARNEAERMGIKILPPDVNTSLKICSIKDKNIVVGFNAIKGVGGKAADSIVETRNALGRNFENIFDLCANVDLSVVNKTALESLIYSGAFDCFGIARSQNFDAIEPAREYGKFIQQQRESSQVSMFGEAQESISLPKIPKINEWELDKKLLHERDVLGFYISGSPLDKFKYDVEGISTIKLDTIENENIDENFGDTEYSESDIGDSKFAKLKKLAGTTQKIAGIISEKKILYIKSGKNQGKPFAILTIEDIYSTKSEVMVWSDLYPQFAHLFEKDKIIVVEGKISFEAKIGKKKNEEENDEKEDDEDEILKITATNIFPIEEAKNHLKKVGVELSLDKLQEKELDEITNLCKEQKGECSLYLMFASESGSDLTVKSKSIKVNNSDDFLDKLNDYPSVSSVRLRK